MQKVEAGLVYREAIALIEKALMLCDDAAIGKAATPHLDLGLNLLRMEYQAAGAPAPAQE